MYWAGLSRASILSCLSPSCFLIERVFRPGRPLGLYWTIFGHVSFSGWLSRFQSWSPLLDALAWSFACFYRFLSLSPSLSPSLSLSLSLSLSGFT